MRPLEVRVLPSRPAPDSDAMRLLAKSGAICWADSTTAALVRGLKKDQVLLGAYDGGRLVAITVNVYIPAGDPPIYTSAGVILDLECPANLRCNALLSMIAWLTEKAAERGLFVFKGEMLVIPQSEEIARILSMVPGWKVWDPARLPSNSVKVEGRTTGAAILEVIAGLEEA